MEPQSLPWTVPLNDVLPVKLLAYLMLSPKSGFPGVSGDRINER